MSGDEVRRESYSVESIAASYLRAAFDEIIEDLYGFLAQFNIVVEVELETDELEGLEPLDIEDIEEFLKEETDGTE